MAREFRPEHLVFLHKAVLLSFSLTDIQLSFSGRRTLVVYKRERLDYLHIVAYLIVSIGIGRAFWGLSTGGSVSGYAHIDDTDEHTSLTQNGRIDSFDE